MPRNRNAHIILSIGLLALVYVDVLSTQHSDASGARPLRVLSAVGMREVIADLEPKFERATGYNLTVSFGSGAAIVKRLEEGENADVVMLPRSGVDRLADGGKLLAGSVVDLATSHVGAAVRGGAPEPDISTPEVFKRAMLAAKTVACPDPALGGSSGIHIAKIFERLGIAEALKPKLVLVGTPDQAETMPGHLVARGEAEIGLHQIQELLAVPGIKVLGPLPGDLQGTFLFSAAVTADAVDAKAAKALVEFLTTPEARAVIKAKGMVSASPRAGGATVNVDCDTGGTVGPILSNLQPGDVVVVHGTCQENILIQPELSRITIDGRGMATFKALDAHRPAVQILGREVMIKGFTITGGSFGIAINRGATAVIEGNTIQHAGRTGIEISQNSFARLLNNTIQHSGEHGIYVLGSSTAHIGVFYTDDNVPRPNVIRDNGGDGIQVLRSSTARIIGNTLMRNRLNGLTVQQASHADVAGNVFDGNSQHGIRVIGNSGVNLADSAMRLFQQPNTTMAPNGLFGIQCEVGGYVEGAVGSLRGNSGVKDMSDSSCIDRSSP